MNKDNVAEKIIEKLAMAVTHSKTGDYAVNEAFVRDLLTSHRLSLKEELMKKLPREKEIKNDYDPNWDNYNSEVEGFNSCLSQVKESLTSVFKEK